MKTVTFRLSLDIVVKYDSNPYDAHVVSRKLSGTLQPGGEARQLLAAFRELLADVQRVRRKARSKGR